MKIVIDMPDNEIPTKQDIVTVDLHFIDGKVCECDYPYLELPKGHGDLKDVGLLEPHEIYDGQGFTEVVYKNDIDNLPSVNPQEPMREFTEEEAKAYSKALDKIYKPIGINVFEEPSGDLISKQAVFEQIHCWIGSGEYRYTNATHYLTERVKHIPSAKQERTGHCKDCKWWKDSDGAFRRGIGAESRCPINREEVYEGNGYCFLFEPRESEDEE